MGIEGKFELKMIILNFFDTKIELFVDFDLKIELSEFLIREYYLG